MTITNSSMAGLMSSVVLTIDGICDKTRMGPVKALVGMASIICIVAENFDFSWKEFSCEHFQNQNDWLSEECQKGHLDYCAAVLQTVKCYERCMFSIPWFK